jgi:hypothetical protein
MPAAASAGLVLFLSAQGVPAQTGGPTLNVRVAGAGMVTSEPSGIACEPTCSAPFPRTRTGPQVVQLTATPAAGHELEAWGESCSGVATTCTVVMGAERVVTARFRPAPPPPPAAPPGNANLTVIASAGGSVSGAGIACPSDCVEPLPVGTAAALSAAAAPGYRFEGWQGACSGGGGCSAAIGGPTLVRAEFAPVARSLPLLGGPADSDGDSTRDARDLCPDTPRGVKARSNGCGPLDPMLHGELLIDRMEGATGEATHALRGIPGLKPTQSALRRSLALMRTGAAGASRGAVCPGSARMNTGLGALAKAVRRGTLLLSRAQDKTPDGPAGVGDAAAGQIAWAALHGAKLELTQAAGQGRSAQRLYEQACESLGKKLRVQGQIKDLDDATGLLTLAGGKRFVLPHAGLGNRVAAGSRVTITGRKTESGPDLVEAVQPADAPGTASAELSPCMELRIAPFQDFWKPAPVLHQPKGYMSDGAIWLEGGARLAASPKCAGRPGRYSLAIDLRLGSSPLPITVAADLTDKDDPVQLPVGELNFGTLVVKERRQLSNCPPPSSQATAAKSFPCPVVEVSKKEYKLRVRPTGFYAQAVFDKTEFGLEIASPAPAMVTGLTGVHPTLPASASFAGRGYKPGGAPGPVTAVGQNELFALWPRATYGWDGILFPLTTVGVDHYAGLLWPSVVGKRNGRPFRYAAELPEIVTDRLALCQGTEDCFYKPPWPFGVERGTGQGNGPGFSHNNEQLFAFDFSVPEGGQLVAARGGLVGDVVENLSKNYNPCDPDTPDADGPGNYVRIDHEDGTYGYYVHLKKDTVPLTVGEWVERGDPVGEAGNTGRSCGPHLHFQSSVTSASSYYGQTLRIRFNVLLEGEDTPLDCYIPLTDDVLTSTNG